jgi:hypothetical protein
VKKSDHKLMYFTGQAGTVTLEGEQDYSGVTVGLYKAVEPDKL